MPRTFSGTAKDPEFRKDRGRLGAAATNSIDGRIRSIARRSDELTDEQRDALVEIAAPTDDDLIRRLVDAAPELTDEQVNMLRPVLARIAQDGGQ